MKASGSLKHVRDSTDRDWTFIRDHKILSFFWIMIKKFRFFDSFFKQKMSQKLDLFWALFWLKTGLFLGPFLGIIIKTKKFRLNITGRLVELWPKKINFQNQVDTKMTSGHNYEKKNFFFCVSSYIWPFSNLFSENVDFEKNSLKNQPFSNFVLISGFFVKTEKNADTTPKFTQNREENPKTIG